jgi:hypothetical protein
LHRRRRTGSSREDNCVACFCECVGTHVMRSKVRQGQSQGS